MKNFRLLISSLLVIVPQFLGLVACFAAENHNQKLFKPKLITNRLITIYEDCCETASLQSPAE